MSARGQLSFLDVLVPCQRWQGGRDTYRPPLERIDPRRYEVAPVGRAEAKSFVLAHHYSRKCSSTVRCFGMYRSRRLVGVAVFGNPQNDDCFKPLVSSPRSNLELGRFVLVDDVEANGETWFLARCFELLRREGFEGVLSFSDPAQRTNSRGELVFGGHLGGIYQAHNAVYLGRASPATLHLLPDGSVFSNMGEGKIRLKKQGWEHNVRTLVDAGADSPGLNPSAADLRAWLALWRPRLTRNLRHHGNHKYVWGLTRAVRRALPTGLPGPKRLALVGAPEPAR